MVSVLNVKSPQIPMSPTLLCSCHDSEAFVIKQNFLVLRSHAGEKLKYRLENVYYVFIKLYTSVFTNLGNADTQKEKEK